MKITINNLNYAYTLNNNVLENINLEINSGDFMVIKGHNGSGKTTLIRLLIKELITTNGQIFYDDVDINNFNDFQSIGYVPQKFSNFAFKYPLSVTELLKSSSNDQKQLNKVLTQIKMLDFKNENFNNLSGGQQQRIFIARALLHNPKLLILDEPFVGIDLASVEILMELLKELNESGITIILVTHNKHYIAKYVNKILVLNKVMFYYGDLASYDDRMCDLC